MSVERGKVSLERLLDHISPISGFGRGISAFLATYVILLIAWFVEAAFATAKTNFLGLLHRGLEFTYIAHFGVPGGPLVLNGQPTIVPFVVYSLVPAVILFYHGSRIAMQNELPSLVAAFISGASVVTGYVLAIAFSMPALTWLAGVLFDIMPGLPAPQGGYYAGGWLPLVLFAGLLYPLVCGGLAGGLVHRWRHR